MAGAGVAIRFEGVIGRELTGASSRGADAPAPLPEEVLEVAGLTPAGPARYFELEPMRRGRAPGGSGRAGVVELDALDVGADQGQFLLVRCGDGIRVVLPGSGDADHAFRFPVTPGPAGRGPLGTALRWAVQTFVFPLTDPVLGTVGEGFVRRWEKDRRPHRMRFFTPAGFRHPGVDPAGPGDVSSGRALLLVHGTNSLSHSASGLGSLPRGTVATLADAYGKQVLAFDHPTLATDPRDNAKWLESWLANIDHDIELDVLAHSRGGLVMRWLAEVLSLPPRVALRSLNLIATPNQGTPLAHTRHLGRLVDRLLSLAAVPPDSPLTLVAEGALTVAKQLAVGVTGGLDGLAAMVPTGPWLDELESHKPASATYRAVVADFEPRPGSGLWHAVKDAGLDAVFEGLPNDGVVPTLGALDCGGGPGNGFAEMFVLREDDHVGHSGYFSSELLQPLFGAWLRPHPEQIRPPMSSRRLDPEDVRALARVGPEWGITKALDLTCFAPETTRGPLRELAEKAGAALWPAAGDRSGDHTRPVVVLVPGIMGSELALDGTRVWLSPWQLAQGRFDRLRLPAPAGTTVSATEVLCYAYRPGLERLKHDFDVVAFPFDWRQDIAGEAASLATLLRELVGLEPEGVPPVHVVAHSMGGLLVRMARRADGSTFDAMRARGGRVVLAGTPNHGSFSTPLALLGRHPLLRVLAGLDAQRSSAEWVDVAWSFPGLVQLLPRPGLPGGMGTGDHAVDWLYDPGTWCGRPDATATAAVLDSAKRFHAALEGDDGKGVHLVLGDGVETPVGVRRNGSEPFEIFLDISGDGTVAHRCAALDGATTHYAARVAHGDLLKDKRTLEAIVDLLHRDTTRLLRDEPATGGARGSSTRSPAARWVKADEAERTLDPMATGSRDATAPRPIEAWTRLDAAKMVVAALEPTLGKSRQLPALQVELVHGELEAADYPVLVGHATGTPMAGAESRCDQLLGGQLSRLQLLGLYPDRPGDVRLVRKRRPEHRLAGCILVALDSSQPLTHGALAEIVSRAVLAYVEREIDREPPGQDAALDEPRTLALSAVTVGSGPVFGISVDRSVLAIVEGVHRANQLLDAAGFPTVARLQLVERYAAKVEWALWAFQHRLENWASDGQHDVVPLDLVAEVRTAGGARPGMPSPRYDSGSWERLSVEVVDGHTVDEGAIWLRYRFARDRAAVAEQPRRIDRVVLAELLRDVAAYPERSAEIGVVLFEELLPVELKDELGRIDNLVLQVDARTADIPWELVIDRLGGPDPLACRAGLLRQFRESHLRVPSPRNAPAPALVLGDPPTELGRLPAAAQEARQVAERLRQVEIDVEHLDFDGPALKDSSARIIRTALWSRDYRIVHVAAHGFTKVTGPGGTETGIAIGNKALLTADDFRNLRTPPELVFLNCCHLGRVDTDSASAKPLDAVEQHSAAASLAAALIRIGVKAVVVAGWQVDDALACRFATTFYERLVDGVLFGEAVKQARAAAYRSPESADTTWAAYQCYGDPAFRLRLTPRTRWHDVETVQLRDSAVRWLEDFLHEAEKVDDPAHLLAQLEDVDQQIERRWPYDGELLALRARAYGDIGRLPEAAARYERAVEADDGRAPLRSLEQLVNVYARQAIEVRSRFAADSDPGGEDAQEVEEALKCAERWSTVLETLTRTSERHGLTGGLRKRLAVVKRVRGDGEGDGSSGPPPWAKQAELAIAAYTGSAMSSKGKDLWGFRNALQLAAITRIWPKAMAPLLDEEWGRRWAADLRRDPGRGPFWDRVAVGDSLLTAALVPSEKAEVFCPPVSQDDTVVELARLIGQNFQALVRRIGDCYLAARVGGYRYLEWRSLVAHVWELGMLADNPLRQDLIGLWRHLTEAPPLR